MASFAKFKEFSILSRKCCSRKFHSSRWTKVVPKVKNARIRRKTVYLCLKTIFKLILMYFQGVKVDFDFSYLGIYTQKRILSKKWVISMKFPANRKKFGYSIFYSFKSTILRKYILSNSIQ